jgi:hypothetical protein
VENKHVLVPVLVVLAYNAWRVHDSFKRGESSSYEGDERPVTETDVLMTRALLVLVAGIYLYGLCFGE